MCPYHGLWENCYSLSKCIFKAMDLSTRSFMYDLFHAICVVYRFHRAISMYTVIKILIQNKIENVFLRLTRETKRVVNVPLEYVNKYHLNMCVFFFFFFFFTYNTNNYVHQHKHIVPRVWSAPIHIGTVDSRYLDFAYLE